MLMLHNIFNNCECNLLKRQMLLMLNEDSQVNIFGTINLKNEVSFEERVSYLRMEINRFFEAQNR